MLLWRFTIRLALENYPAKTLSQRWHCKEAHCLGYNWQGTKWADSLCNIRISQNWLSTFRTEKDQSTRQRLKNETFMWENAKQCAHFHYKRLYTKERWKWKICFLLTASLNGDIVLSQPFVRCLDKSIYAEMFVTLFRFVPFVLFCFVPFIRRLFLTFCVLRTANSVVTCPWQRVQREI